MGLGPQARCVRDTRAPPEGQEVASQTALCPPTQGAAFVPPPKRPVGSAAVSAASVTDRTRAPSVL